MKKILPNLFLLFFLVSAQRVEATVIQSTAIGGNWNNPATWSPAQVPVAGDNVTIIAGSSVTVPVNAACATLTINLNGQLALSGGNLTVSASCTINGLLYCHPGSILQGTATLTINNGA